MSPMTSLIAIALVNLSDASRISSSFVFCGILDLWGEMFTVFAIYSALFGEMFSA